MEETLYEESRRVVARYIQEVNDAFSEAGEEPFQLMAAIRPWHAQHLPPPDLFDDANYHEAYKLLEPVEDLAGYLEKNPTAPPTPAARKFEMHAIAASLWSLRVVFRRMARTAKKFAQIAEHAWVEESGEEYKNVPPAASAAGEKAAA